MKLPVVCILLGFVISHREVNTLFCNPSSQISGNFSTIPKLPDLPQQFQTRIEVNIVDKNLTADYMEYFDYLGNRIKLSYLKNDQNGVILYLYNTDEAIYVTDNLCKVANLSAQPEMNIFGEFSDDGYLHMMSSNFALKFGKRFGEVYLGPDVIRGINVEHWQACLYWKDVSANFTVDYYFSTPNVWTTASLFTSVPVQADVTGIYLQSDGTEIPIHHIYNYYAFQPEITEALSTLFETPPGVICPGRKNIKNLPTLPSQFFFRQEMVVPLLDAVTTIDVWYDEEVKLMRSDYRPLVTGPPTYNLNPLTEVYDFNEGVMYLRDNTLGNCTVLPFKNTTFGVIENSSAMKYNGSLILNMKNPFQLFYLNYNYTYVGKRDCRGMTCDVFAAVDPSYRVEGYTNGMNATFEFFFLSDEFINFPNDGSSVTRSVPVKSTINIASADYYTTYNYMDFDGNHPDLSVFDVSSCYNEAAQLHFKIRFPGQINPSMVNPFIYQARKSIGMTMNVSPLRIQHLRVDYDYADVYLYASLLDRTPPQFQFIYVGDKSMENQDDMVIGNVKTPVQCSQFCVFSDNFTCNSFEFCPSDTQGSCRLSKTHIGDGKAKLINSTCGLFSRTINAKPVQETPILKAYSILRQNIYQEKFMITVYIENQPIATYVGIHTEVTFGWIAPTEMPTFSGHFSYRQELVIPSQGLVLNSQVWFDTDYKLTRYDYHNVKPEPPFYTTNPVTVIHNFNTGIQYTIDKFFENCTVSQLQPGGFDTKIDIKDRLKNGAYIVQMKSPLELFHITPNFRFLGQKTVRGLLTNLYEVVVKKYTMPGLQGSYDAILEYYFLMDGWLESGLNDGTSTSKFPVKLDISIIERGLFLSYNFYDFEVQHPDLTLFDIKNCFPSQDQHNFQVTFPGPFHPYLDDFKKLFQMESQAKMAAVTGASILRFQETSVNYDAYNIYITSTILGKPPYLTDFTLIPGNVTPKKSDGVIMNLNSPSECAKTCLSTNMFPCNSFNYCPTTKACYLSKTHVINGTVINNTTACSHYTRTVNASSVTSPDMWTAYNNLKNAVYSGLLNIKIPTANNTVKLYTAASIKDTEPRPTDAIQGGKILQHFTVQQNKELSIKTNHLLTGLAVDDCAVACLMEELFDCQSFEYCLSDRSCLLSTINPDLNRSSILPRALCNLYGRQYLDNYSEVVGTTFPTNADEVILNVPTPNICAKQCTQTAKCKSFDYCQNKACRLKNKHILDTPGSFYQTSITCNHYSRNYIDDFRFVQGKKMNIGPSLEFLGVSVDQCAKLCVEQEGTLCHSFAYCVNSTKCELLPENPKFLPSGTVTQNNFCDLYIRRFNPANMPPHPPNNTRTVNETQYEYITQKESLTGPVVGTAFGVFIVGLVIGAASVFFFRKYRNKDDDINMSIINNEET